ncbi:MAG TPA: hypothetical protein VJ576_07045 [Rhodocyclaceae bacterium]|nr:hypothetical protein [Rhodocyclaceae bacterium]
MADHNDCECDWCTNPANGAVRSQPLSRPQALSLYIRLQRQGFLPSMCEDRAGRCRVCYGQKNRLER